MPAASGRPVTAPRITAAHILQHLRCNPLRLGYRTTVWSVKLLAAASESPVPLSNPIPIPCGGGVKAMGLRCKRPRYFYEEKPRTGRKKRGDSAPPQAASSPHCPASVRSRQCYASFPSCVVPGLCGRTGPCRDYGQIRERVLFGAINLLRRGHRCLRRARTCSKRIPGVPRVYLREAYTWTPDCVSDWVRRAAGPPGARHRVRSPLPTRYSV